MNTRPVIVLEFNEIVPRLIDRFIAAGQLPNFKRLRERSKVMVTEAQEAQQNLEPWIQWITVHSGLTYEQHGVFHLDEGAKLEDKCIWDVVSDRGGKAWVCGSMNVRYDRPLNGMLLPDAWSTEAKPYPDMLTPFCKFLQTYVQEHTNDSVPLTKGDYLAFAKFMATNGISLKTVKAIASQLAGERIGKREGYQRAVILDKLQWDVFAHHYRRMKPNLSTFFSNSTAHYQHKYWRNMEPEHFELKPEQHEQDRFKDAVLFGYQQMDGLIGDALRLAGDEACIVLASALSQQPFTGFEETGGKRFYRPRKFDLFGEAMKLADVRTYRPVMSEQFHIHFHTGAAAAKAAEQLSAAKVGDRQAFLVELQDNSIFCGCKLFDDVAEDTVLSLSDGDEVAFYDVFYQADSLKSGMHHPDGVFWVAEPQGVAEVVDEKVPLCDVAPTILELLGIEPLEKMTGHPVIAHQQLATGGRSHVAAE